MLHDSRNKDIASVTDTIDLKLLSFHIFINQNRIFNSCAEDDFHVFFNIRRITGDNHVLSAKDIAGAHQNRVSDFFGRLKCLNLGENGDTLRPFDVKPVAKFLKTLPVLSKVNRICARSKNTNSLSVKVFRKFDCSSAAKSHDDADRFFDRKNIHHIDRGKRLKVKAVGCVKVGGDGLRVVVDNSDLVAKLF